METVVFYKKTTHRGSLITIPKGKIVIAKGRSNSKYRRVKYKDTIGWVYMPSFKTEKKYKYKGNFKITKIKRKKKNYSSYSGGTVHVKGYYRKDGTYVRPHTRKKRN